MKKKFEIYTYEECIITKDKRIIEHMAEKLIAFKYIWNFLLLFINRTIYI